MDKEKISKFEIACKIGKILPTNKISTYLNDVVSDFVPMETKKELKKVLPSPLSINKSDTIGAFINSEFNHDGDSYRSPWSNEYFPTSEGHKLLPNELRELEVQLNTLMKLYTKLYYGPTAVSSVFIWEQGDSISSGFNCAVLFKNVIEKSRGIVNSTLDSINIINVKFIKEKDRTSERIKAQYKICSTMLYDVNFGNFQKCGYTGNVTKLGEESSYPKSYLDYETHCETIGTIVENMENFLRANLDEIYMKKTESIIAKMRNTFILGRQNNSQANLVKDLFTEKEKIGNIKKEGEEDVYETQQGGL